MDWFRLYHGTCTDRKILKAEALSGLPRHLVIAAWIAVLEYASAHDERGSIEGIEALDIAVTIGCSEQEAATCLEAMERAGLVAEGRVAAWEKRQFDSDSSTERVRRHRERRKAQRDAETGRNVSETLRSVTETRRNVTVTGCNAPDSDTESETDSESTPPSPLPSVGDLPPHGGRADASAPCGAPAAREGKPKTGSPKRKSDSARGSRLPPDWQPSEDDLRFAASLGMSPAEIRIEADRFRDYWAAQTGQRARKADWRATWRNWCRKAVDQKTRGQPPRAPPTEPQDPWVRAGLTMIAEERAAHDDSEIVERPLPRLPH